MGKSLRKKLALSYMLVAMICIVLVSVLANFYLEKQFKNYVIETHNMRSEDIVKSISSQFGLNGNVNTAAIERIGISALENGLILKVVDNFGTTLWDARVHNNGMCEAILSHFSNNMINMYSNWHGGFVSNDYDIVSSDKKRGTVSIGYYGPYYFSDNDVAFLNTLNRIFLTVGAASLMLALMIGLFMSGALSRPILKIIRAAEAISKGKYKDRIKENSNISEIDDLIQSINGLAADLEKQETLRKRLTADVAHELRTPLATLQSHMEAIIDGIWDPTIERIKSCHEETMRINRMVGDLEKLAQYESESLILYKTEFDLSEVTNNIITNFQGEFLSKNVELRFQPEIALINGDKDKITQVVVNLLSNALKYTQSSGKVEVKIEKDNGSVNLTVKDSGIGISEEDLPYIFERFYRVDKSRNRMTGGAGIGLTITKSIVEAHNGTITVSSELNKGTDFIVKLPIKN
jgi:two-component system sensor histidine kinase BaeS